MPRPFTLNVYALRLIPNTQLAKDVEDRGFSIPPVDAGYLLNYRRTLGNILVFFITTFKVPRWLYKYLRNKALPVHTKQPSYPVLFKIVRALYLMRRGINHLKFMDFSVIPGKPGYYLWKLKIISFWQRFILKRFYLSKTKL